MIYYDYVLRAFGYVCFLIFTARLPVAYLDGRIFYRVVKRMGYPGSNLWFTLRKQAIPHILSGPCMLWLEPGNFLRRTSAPDLYDVAMAMLQWQYEQDAEGTDIVVHDNQQ